MADTTSIKVTFNKSQEWWIEQGMVLCRPNPDRRASARRDDASCAQFLPSEGFYHLSIGAGDSVEIRLEPREKDARLLIRFLPCVEKNCSVLEAMPGQISPREVPNGFVVISETALRAAGPLSMSGRITLGRELSVGGRPDFLLGGSYEIREQNPLTRAFGRRSVVVEQGELIPGAAVELFSRGQPSERSTGHFFLAEANGYPSLRAIALSGAGGGALRMSVEGAEPFTIDPDWIDSVIANPVFICLALLLGLLLNAAQLIAPLMKIRVRG
ncbi:hypothetical protein V8J39_22775 [Frigidibacter sp. MR17.24]